MFPTASLSGSSAIPPGATFWMPKPEDIDEEGIGEFRGTWLIKDVPVREARQLMRQERRVAEVVGSLAATAEDFDRIARAVEDGLDPDEPDSSYALNAQERAALDEFAVSEDEPGPLDDLELGVAGLVYALATVRIIPAASCRGHTGDRSWSEVPVVLFAATEIRARALQPLVEATGCRFETDAVRSHLLAVQARSILDTMALAEAILGARQSFVRPRSAVQQHRPPGASRQAHLS
jgi:hypothetical protein